MISSEYRPGTTIQFGQLLKSRNPNANGYYVVTDVGEGRSFFCNKINYIGGQRKITPLAGTEDTGNKELKFSKTVLPYDDVVEGIKNFLGHDLPEELLAFFSKQFDKGIRVINR